MKIKNILSDVGNWVIAGLTFLGTIILFAGIDGATNWYFIGVGIIFLLPFIINIIRILLRTKKATDENAERVNELISHGDQITVNLDNLEIRSNSYQHEIEVGSGYRTRNEYIDVNHNVILIEVAYKNDTIKNRLNIDMDTTKLKMHFAIKQTTELYVDPKNPNNHYLDLRFLET